MKIFLFLILFLFPFSASANFASHLCQTQPKKYRCLKMKFSKDKPYREWKILFPSLYGSIIAINRRNSLVWSGQIIAIPIQQESFNGYSPFKDEIEWANDEDRFIIVDLNNLAWGAFERVSKNKARLVKWGPASGGSKVCKETREMKCKTPVGLFTISEISKRGKRSGLYPLDCTDKKKCGHPMPFYMRFGPNGEGIHADKWLLGKNSSHGCVRVLREDAKWLNKEFVRKGTPIIILEY